MTRGHAALLPCHFPLLWKPAYSYDMRSQPTPAGVAFCENNMATEATESS